jgi:lipopolysaccharide export system permease protein
VAAVFAVSLMQRRREMTAIEAAGITKSRILRSVFWCGALIVGLAAADRELILPRVKDQLVRTPQNWVNQEKIPFGIYHDLENGIKITGAELSLVANKISIVEVRLPTGLDSDLSRIQAASALLKPANADHPAGLLLRQVAAPDDGDHRTSESSEGSKIVYWPGDTSWLEPNQCFVVCHVDAYQAAYGKKLLEYQSVPEMLVELRKPRRWFGSSSQINVHSRILQPTLDLTLLLLGLPLIISRADKNIFASAGICLLIVGGMQLSVICCHSLGAYHLIQPVALAAWFPVMLFAPLAVVAMWRIDG